MANLTPTSAAAIARLRTYVPPPTTWWSLPLTRRAAVLILLFADRKGELRVVLTMRASTLSSYAGQAALPGGKSDSLLESPVRTARREAYEEIGLPMPSEENAAAENVIEVTPHLREQDAFNSSAHAVAELELFPPTTSLPNPFQLEHLCQLPTNLAKTQLGVRPVVAFLKATAPFDHKGNAADVAATLVPRLDAKEVAAVFSGPLHNFLRAEDEGSEQRNVEGIWYRGDWMDWHETKFRMHNFFVPVRGQVVTRPSSPTALRRPTSSTFPYRDAVPNTPDRDPLETLARFRVFGMTARILVDCARVAYAQEPEFEHNSHFGDEAIIERLLEGWRLGEERERGAEFFDGDVKRALDVADSRRSSNGSAGERHRL